MVLPEGRRLHLISRCCIKRVITTAMVQTSNSSKRKYDTTYTVFPVQAFRFLVDIPVNIKYTKENAGLRDPR